MTAIRHILVSQKVVYATKFYLTVKRQLMNRSHLSILTTFSSATSTFEYIKDMSKGRAPGIGYLDEQNPGGADGRQQRFNVHSHFIKVILS